MIDDVVAKLIAAEEKRQREGLELIPSENYVSRDVLTAMGSIFTNKYSEGYPGKRYYGGQENTDVLEQLAIDRAKQLFKADHANVQPHSGAPANEAVYSAWLEPGDTVSIPKGVWHQARSLGSEDAQVVICFDSPNRLTEVDSSITGSRL